MLCRWRRALIHVPNSLAGCFIARNLAKVLGKSKAEKAKLTERAAVAALEQEIDRLVYPLYGLTPAEIKLVEESTSR